MNEYETIEVEKIEDFEIIFLNRPKSLNSLSYKLADELYTEFSMISQDNSIRTVILTGRGNAFCAGGDVMEFKSAEDPQAFISKLAGKLHEGIRLIKTIDTPVIAAINGPCFGAGLGFACACDLRISTRGAKFGAAFTGVGLSPDSSSTFHLPRIMGLSIASDLLLTNRVINAEEALKYNLISRICETDEELIEEAKRMARQVRLGAPIALSKTKKLLNQSFSQTLDEQLDDEKQNIVATAGTEDFQEGIDAFLGKRKPSFNKK